MPITGSKKHRLSPNFSTESTLICPISSPSNLLHLVSISITHSVAPCKTASGQVSIPQMWGPCDSGQHRALPHSLLSQSVLNSPVSFLFSSLPLHLGHCLSSFLPQPVVYLVCSLGKLLLSPDTFPREVTSTRTTYKRLPHLCLQPPGLFACTHQDLDIDPGHLYEQVKVMISLPLPQPSLSPEA